MKVAIIEDEPLAAERLRDLLGGYAPARVEVVGEAESVAEAIEGLPGWGAELLLCDIQLADGLSFTIWEHVAVDCPTIFTTAYEEYALRAFRVNSVDYLLKPVEPEALYAALDRFRERFAPAAAAASSPVLTPELIAQVVASIQRPPSYRERLISKVGDKLVPLACAEVAYFHSVDRITWAHGFDGGRQAVSETLEQLAGELDPARFARLNRAVIAQARAIEQLDAYSNSRYRVQLAGRKGGEPIVVARERVAEIKRWLAGG